MVSYITGKPMVELEEEKCIATGLYLFPADLDSASLMISNYASSKFAPPAYENGSNVH